MTSYVFDTEPLIAFFYDEPGASTVSEHLQAIDAGEADGVISHATAAEIVYKIARFETGSPNQAQPTDQEYAAGRQDIRILRGYGVTVETPPWDAVAQVKGPGGISLGDSYAAALALNTGATLVVGADPEFGDLSDEVELQRVRDDPV
jgi:predicted nucleic acid-binding protein